MADKSPQRRYLGEWPQRFDDVLEDHLFQGEGVSLAGRIGTWYRELFSTYAAPSFDFLRDRLKAQIAEHFDGRLGVSTRGLMFGADNADSMHWFAAAEAARLLGVAPDILANLVITQQIDGRVHQEGRRLCEQPKENPSRYEIYWGSSLAINFDRTA